MIQDNGDVLTYIIQSTKHRVLSHEEELELGRRIRQGDVEAKHTLILHNVRLVSSYIKRYKDSGLPYPDLIQEGVIGLQRAAEKFDPEKGNKFSTYATWWIIQSMTRAIAEKSSTIRKPVHQTEKKWKLKRATRELSQVLGRTPTRAEIAKRLEWTIEQVDQVIKANQVLFSLDSAAHGNKPNGDSDILPLIETIRADEDDRLDALVVNDTHAMLRSLMQKMQEQQREVLTLRYGLNGEAPLKQPQVAHRLGITREQVRSLERAGKAWLERRLKKEMRKGQLPPINELYSA